MLSWVSDSIAIFMHVPFVLSSVLRLELTALLVGAALCGRPLFFYAYDDPY
jgi:hypothetical protein